MITIEQIETKEFKIIARNGYDPKEVDEFLDGIMDAMEAQLNTIEELQKQLAAANAAKPVDNAPTQVVRPVQSAFAAPKTEVPDKAFREILEMAQKVKDETIAKAEAEAEAIVAKAQEAADEQLKSLSDEKEALTRQVTDLRAAAADYRTRFEALLAAQQEAIEKASQLF
ncbi:MAG: DivIVA domain-containing protein [Clostridia bacterium]|nr:DivIVA domain-containing protein [Clostridia bacterium]